MGFLIFAYRKLSLTRKLNDLNFRSMILSQKEQQITQQIHNLEQAKAAAQNMVNVFTSVSLSKAQMNAYDNIFEKNEKGDI